MAEIEIGLGRPSSVTNTSRMLIRAHRAGIDVEIGVELAQAHRKAARLQQAPERREHKPLPREETTPPVMKMEPHHGPSV